MPNLQEIRNTVLTPLSVSQDTALRNSHSMTLAGLDLASRFDVAQVPLKTSHSVSERLDLAEFDVKTHQKNAETKSKAFAQQQIQQFRELEVKAQAAGIDVAKKAFFKELFNVALAGVGLGLSVLATAVTGGAGAPILAAASVAFTLAVADAGCALANWYRAAHDGEGLKMGSDTISNTLYALLDKMGVNDDNAEYWARATSTTLRLGLTIGTLFSGMVSPANVPGALGSAMSTIKIAKLGVGAAGNSALSFQLDNTSKAKSKVGQDLKNHQEAMTTSQLDKTKEQLSRTTTNLDRERTFSDILARKNEQVFNQLERAQHAIEQKDKAILELTEKLKLFIQSGVSGPEIQQLASEHFT